MLATLHHLVREGDGYIMNFVVESHTELKGLLKDGKYYLCFNSRLHPDWSWSVVHGDGKYHSSHVVAHVPRPVIHRLLSSIGESHRVASGNFWDGSNVWDVVHHEKLPSADTYIVLKYVL